MPATTCPSSGAKPIDMFTSTNKSRFYACARVQVCGQRLVCSSGSVEDSVQVLAHHLLQGAPVIAAVTQPRLVRDTLTGVLLVDGEYGTHYLCSRI